METSRTALLCFSVLALSACDESYLVYKDHCKAPPANWATEADHDRRLDGGGVIDPIYNSVVLDRTGGLNWNGYVINKTELVEYLHQSDGQDPMPMIIMKIDHLTPCKHVEDLRKLLKKSATCQRPEKLCTEVEPEPEPEPPPEEKAETAKTDSSE